MKAPFPWFGGKSLVASAVWQRFGVITNYVEPFFGSGAVLLHRPHPVPPNGGETINDADGFVCNFWRAIQTDPDLVARWADWPVNECDLTARHLWLVQQRDDLTARLSADPEWYDPRIAGYWVWGICSWIGSGWCSGKGPWTSIEGKLVDTRQLPSVSDAGRGINRQLPSISNAGRGINAASARAQLYVQFQELAERMNAVRVCCGDWMRVMTPSVTSWNVGITGIFLDPPYSDLKRTTELYAVDSMTVAGDVRKWAIANGDNPQFRIALCGYESEHAMPKHWTCHAWLAHGGYGSQGSTCSLNAARERIWFSPACLSDAQADLFGAVA